MPKKFYTPSALRTYIGNKKWVMSYNRLTTIVDYRARKVMYIEDYGPENGIYIEGWRALHYPLTSGLVENSTREGGSTIVVVKAGKNALNLSPSFSPFGIEACEYDTEVVRLTFAGLGGAGVSAAYSRGIAKGVTRVQLLEEGGGAKLGRSIIELPAQRLLIIGIDDTDNTEVGATYALAHNIALDVTRSTKSRYLSHVNAQLYPYNEFKTRNCFSTAIGIVFTTDTQKEVIIDKFARALKKHTVSPNTAMAVFEGFHLSERFRDYATSLKFRFAHDIDEIKAIAKDEQIDIYPITGERGLFGAIAAIGLYDKPDFAAKLPSQCL